MTENNKAVESTIKLIRGFTKKQKAQIEKELEEMILEDEKDEEQEALQHSMKWLTAPEVLDYGDFSDVEFI